MGKEKRKSFPMLPVSHWWALRDRFKQTMPGVVTDSYIGTVLRMKPESARANVLPFLKDMGLIGNEGKPLDLAKEWRDDNKYAEVCHKIRKKVYPEELIEAAPDPSAEIEAVRQWFALKTGAGEAATKRMTAIYVVISDADVLGKPNKKDPKKGAPEKNKPKSKPKPKASQPAKGGSTGPTQTLPTSTPSTPGIHIDLQIHISPDASMDQIDQVFASMAKHIYRK
jgi:hypothetical protein